MSAKNFKKKKKKLTIGFMVGGSAVVVLGVGAGVSDALVVVDEGGTGVELGVVESTVVVRFVVALGG